MLHKTDMPNCRAYVSMDNVDNLRLSSLQYVRSYTPVSAYKLPASWLSMRCPVTDQNQCFRDQDVQVHPEVVFRCYKDNNTAAELPSTCLENLEMSGNLASVRELSGI